ncbi:MAG: hypothetical protein M3Z16_07025 [Pseudomonadota bacterium]|nr:hypothetical protein [Pseudomonadota bacterium]
MRTLVKSALVAAALASAALSVTPAQARGNVAVGVSLGSGHHGGYYRGGGYYRRGYWGPGPFWGGVGIGVGLGTVGYYGRYGPYWDGYYDPYYDVAPGYVVTTPVVVERVGGEPLRLGQAVPAARAPDPIFYGKNGQSAARTESDRQECNRWATTQSNALNDGSIFQRATYACMEGRGYTVK